MLKLTLKELALKEFTNHFEHFKYPSNCNSQQIISALHSKLENYLISIIPEQYDELLQYMLGSPFKQTGDYFEVKKRLFRRSELNINATYLSHNQIRNEMIYKFLKIYFMETENILYAYDDTLIDAIVSIIRPTITYEKYYTFTVTESYESNNTDEIIVLGYMNAKYSHEYYFEDVKDTTKTITSNPRTPITYENFLSVEIQQFLFIVDGYVFNFEDECHTKVLYSDPPKGVKKINFYFPFNTYNNDYDMTVEELFVGVTLKLKRDAYTVWEKYIHEAIEQYENKNFETAFLLGAVAIESLIEYSLYQLNTLLRGYIISRLADLSPQDGEELLSKNRTNKNVTELEWVFIKNQEYYNSNRGLIKEKFKDIIYLLEFFNDKNEQEIIETFGDNASIYSKMQEELYRIFGWRNTLAHGEEITEENIEFKSEFENLLTVLFRLIFILKNSSISAEINSAIQNNIGDSE